MVRIGKSLESRLAAFAVWDFLNFLKIQLWQSPQIFQQVKTTPSQAG